MGNTNCWMEVLQFQNALLNYRGKLSFLAEFNYKIINDIIIYKAYLIGYEPAGLTVHPPPQNDRGWVHFFRMGV